jgi:centrosomal protein CEP76
MAEDAKKNGDTAATSPPTDAPAADTGAVKPAAGGGTGDAPNGEKAPLSSTDANPPTTAPAAEGAGGDQKDPKAEPADKEAQKKSDEAMKKADAQNAAIKRKAAWKKMNKKKAEEGEEEDDDAPPAPKKSIFSCLPGKKSKVSVKTDGIKFDRIFRPFEISISLTGIQNVLSEDVDAFFCVKVTAVNPRAHKNKTEGKLLPEFTGAKLFSSGEKFVFDNPEQLYSRNFFSLSYAELQKHHLQVDMWKISKCSFNTYHGVGYKNLFQIANSDPNVSVFLKKAISPAEAAKKKGKSKGSVYDVALFQVNVQLEEIFDFSLRYENFCFEPNIYHKDYKNWMKTLKTLTFIVPKNVNSDPQNNRKCTTKANEWVMPLGDNTGFIWKNPLEFVFSGTRTQLTTSCFLVSVSSARAGVKPPMGPNIGKVLLGLTSILELSVFKGVVKTLSTMEKEFNIGKLSGNVRFRLRSKNIGNYVDTLPLGCPMQPSEASLLHLKRKEKHLVVSITKCEGLPIADPEFGWSDPFLRVSWDNMMKRSWVSPGTTRPVYNLNFYFPVRFFSSKLENDKKYRDTALQYELQSKGPINIMVWDDDPNSSELLGAFTLPLWEILTQTTKAKRTIKGPVKVVDEENDNEFAAAKKLQWYDEVEMVRIYDGGKQVGGTTLKTKMATTTKPLIFFEAFFYPDDWPMDMKFDARNAESEKAEKWMTKERAFRSENRELSKQYKQAFPESVGALPVPIEMGAKAEKCRRFPSLAENPSMELVALPAFLTKIITPEEYTRAPTLMHWVNSFTFNTDSRQTRHGIIERWNDPQMLLFARQGSPQDHAILLCSVLLGAKRDAYVVKGMLWQEEADMFEAKDGPKKNKKDKERSFRLVEHAWVMTREPNDWVTFWEASTRELYHLPQRYKSARAKKKKADAEAEARALALAKADEEENEEEELANREDFFDTMVPDVQLGADEIEGMPIVGALPTIGRNPKGKSKAAKKGDTPAEKMKAALMQQREKLAIAPQRRLLDPEATLVDWLPYDSIEIVFNDENVWSNHQNHHPACITYDIDELGWSKLLKNDAEKQEFKIEHIQQDVVIDAAATPAAMAKMENSMLTEMQENMRLNRRNRGLDTVFDLSRSMREYVDQFLSIHEKLRTLDYDMCPLWATKEDKWTEPMKYCFRLLNKKRPFNKWGSALSLDSQHVSNQEEGWKMLFDMIDTFMGLRITFPARRGKDFDGFPVHFCTGDRDHIRKYLMELPAYKKILEDQQENTAFVLQCKMFGFLNQITSVWLYFGMHEPTKASERK